MSGRGERIVHLSDLDNKFACVTCDMIVCCWKKSSRLVCYWPKLSCLTQIFNSEFLEKGSIFGGNLRVRISFFCAIIKNHRRKIGNLSRSVLENSDKEGTWFPLFFLKKKKLKVKKFSPVLRRKFGKFPENSETKRWQPN